MGYEEQGKEHMTRVYRKTNLDSKESIEDILERQYKFVRRSTSMES